MKSKAIKLSELVIDEQGRVKRRGQQCKCKVNYGATQCPHMSEDKVEVKDDDRRD